MLQRVGVLVPLPNEVLVPISKDKVQVLVLIPRDNAVMKHLFLVVHGESPSVAMDGLE